MEENTSPAEATQAGTRSNGVKDELLGQMAILLHVARKEWPQQTEGTEWDREVQAVLQWYRTLLKNPRRGGDLMTERCAECGKPATKKYGGGGRTGYLYLCPEHGEAHEKAVRAAFRQRYPR